MGNRTKRYRHGLKWKEVLGKWLISLEFAQKLVVRNHLRTYEQAIEKDELDRLKEYKVGTHSDIDKLDLRAKVNKDLIPAEEVTLYELVFAIRRKCLHCHRAPRLLKKPTDMTFSRRA